MVVAQANVIGYWRRVLTSEPFLPLAKNITSCLARGTALGNLERYGLD